MWQGGINEADSLRTRARKPERGGASFMLDRGMFHLKKYIQKFIYGLFAMAKVLAGTKANTGGYLLVLIMMLEIAIVQDVITLQGRIRIAAYKRTAQAFKGFSKHHANNHALFNRRWGGFLLEPGNAIQESQVCLTQGFRIIKLF